LRLEKILKMQNMLETRKIQYLTNLQVFFDKNAFHNLVMLEAEGYSNNELIGVPSFVKKSGITDLPADGILEFDFVTEPLDNEKKDVLNWSTKIIFDLNKFPEKLKGIRVNALKNSDIVLIDN
jgi:hypothetical protein